jgi:hypothetical protein
MPYAYEQDVPINGDVYRKIMDRLGPAPLEGLIVHLVLRQGESSLRYVDVWESKEACDRAIEQRIHPAVFATFEEIGFRPNGEPGRREVDLVHMFGPSPRRAAP